MLALFVLENLSCTGTEELLKDCPVATDFTIDTPVQFNSAGQREFTYLNSLETISCPIF